jgi:hypothetical protein
MAYIARNKAAHQQRCVDWAKRNPDRVRAIQKKNRAHQRPKLLDSHKEYYAANREHLRSKNIESIVRLSDGYVASALRIPVKDAPPELIEAKRVQLMIHRIITRGDSK